MLSMEQMSNLNTASRDIKNKKLILDTAVDVQVLMRILVDKEIVTREEVNDFRKEVREGPKWKAANTYIEQTMAEIDYYEKNPQQLLKAMFDAKLRS